MKQIQIHNIQVELERKPIKNMYLRILPPEGSVHISAPLRMSDEEINRFVASKLEWIQKHQARMEHRPTPRQSQYVTGEQFKIWGSAYTLFLRDAVTKNRVEIIGDEIILHIKSGSTEEQRRKLLKDWYKRALEAEIPFLIARWEQKMGVSSSGFVIRDMKSRWGSCNIRTKQICLNLQLAKLPMRCLEYVVVHELVHLLERNHNKVFRAYMDRYLPDWRTIKRELNGLE